MRLRKRDRSVEISASNARFPKLVSAGANVATAASADSKSERAASGRCSPIRATPRLFDKNARSPGEAGPASSAVNSASATAKSRLRNAVSARSRGGRTRREAKRRSRRNMSPMFTIDVITLFPEVFAPFVGLSIVGRAVERGIVNLRYHHLLDGLSPGERADAPPYGGGPGMVMRLEPIARALDAILAAAPPGERRVIALTTPAGTAFRQADAQRLAALDRLVVVCGHYEGIDDRLAGLYPLETFSLGEFVLTGGEIPALAIVDATVRLLEGAIRPESLDSESFSTVPWTIRVTPGLQSSAA